MLPKEQGGDWVARRFAWRGGFLITPRTTEVETVHTTKEVSSSLLIFPVTTSLVWKKEKKKEGNTPAISNQKLQVCMNQINGHWGNCSKKRILCLKPGVYGNVCKVVHLFKTHICIRLKIRNSYLEHSEAVCQEYWNTFLKTVYIYICIYYNYICKPFTY